MTLLRVEGLKKAYVHYGSEWRRVLRWFGVPCAPKSAQIVLHDVSFSIRAGESVGIVGQNGAGKSTLLKLITGTLTPTAGTIETYGRVAAILELGMGFSSELTGRQNVTHAARLMGLLTDQIQKLLPEIEAFAEVGHYFDAPMRMYSSGMQVRVAFALATAVRPDILIVDEALSVGDAYFQHKCFERIRQYQAEGMTLLLVSHDRGAIQGLCQRALLLHRGTIVEEGTPEKIFDCYNALMAEKDLHHVALKTLKDGKTSVVSGTGEVCLQSIELLHRGGRCTDTVNVGEAVELCVCVEVMKPVDQLVFGYGIKDRLGQVMYGTNTWHTAQMIRRPEVGQRYRFRVQFLMHLGVGSYSIQTALSAGQTHLAGNYEWRDMAFLFNVVNVNRIHFVGSTWLQPEIIIEEDSACSLLS